MASARATIRTIGIGLVLMTILTLAFVLPQHDPEPHDLPIAVAAPAAEQVQQGLGDAVDVRSVESNAEARQLIEDREVLGALIAPRALVASGASPAAAQLLEQFAARDGASVQELAPLSDGDSRGTTLSAMMLPLIIACLPFALLLWRSGASRRVVLGAIIGFAALGGLLVAAIVQGLVNALPGSYVALAGVLAAGLLAIALPAVAAARAGGAGGFAALAMLVFLIGNPASGAANGPYFLPSPWSDISGFLPPGAIVEAVRSVAWFDGAAILTPLSVLGVWTSVGLALLLAPNLAGRNSPPELPSTSSAS